jgi:hypothetical protein
VISGRTITQTVTFGSVGTQPGYASPLTITSTGGINVNSGNGIVGPTGTLWTVANQGLVTAPGVSGIGIDLLSGGLVVNGSNGFTVGYVIASAAGTRLNGTAGNAGAVANGANGANGASSAVITAALIGVDISGGTGTVVNYGTITGTSVFGVHLYTGGSVTNGAGGATTALISGGDTGINITGSTGTVSNAGTVVATGSDGVGVFLDLGGSIANGVGDATSALISGGGDGIMLFDGAGTVTNGGIIAGTGQSGVGIALDLGGSVTNDAGAATAALISGSKTGISVYGDAGTVTNYGMIASTAASGTGAGIYLGAGGTIVNFGTISGANGTAIDFGTAGGNEVVIESGSVLDGAVANFQPGDSFDLAFLGFGSGGSATLGPGNVLQIVEQSGAFTIDLDPAQHFAGDDVFDLANDGRGGTVVTEDPPAAGNLALLSQFAAAGFATSAAQGSGAVATYVLTQLTPAAPPLLTMPDH